MAQMTTDKLARLADAVRMALAWSQYVSRYGGPPNGSHASLIELLELVEPEAALAPPPAQGCSCEHHEEGTFIRRTGPCPLHVAADALLRDAPDLLMRFEKKALGAFKGDGRPCFCGVIKLNSNGVRSHDERCQPVRDWLARAAALKIGTEGGK